MTSKTLQVAVTKASALPEAAQEMIGRDLLESVESLGHLREEVESGIRELDAGLGEELQMTEIIKEARKLYGRG
jgi:HPt (histidine-containing phosphotransfer) domain-containing protein